MNGVGGTGIPRKCLYIISLNFITHKLGARILMFITSMSTLFSNLTYTARKQELRS